MCFVSMADVKIWKKSSSAPAHLRGDAGRRRGRAERDEREERAGAPIHLAEDR